MKQLSVLCNWKRAIGLSAAILTVAIAGWAQTFPQSNRITQELSSGGLVRLPGSVHRLTQKAADMGPVDPAMRLDTLSLHFAPSAEQQIELDALLQAQQDPKSPRYHKWLTQEEYGARFGLSDADLGKITGWLQSQGFAVSAASKSRNALYFGGTVAQVEIGFDTQIHRYLLNGEEHLANATELQVPAPLRGVLMVVRGLNDFRPKPASIRTQPVPNFTLSPSQHFLTPGDWAKIYNVQAIYNAGFTGTNAHVGVVGQTNVQRADIDHFRSASGLSVNANELVTKCISSVSCSSIGLGDLAEADLDIEWAGGIARNATVDYIFAAAGDHTRNVFDALSFAVTSYKSPGTNQVLPVISMSYTACEADLDDATARFFDSIGQQANTQGQTIVVASGDAGVAGCNSQDDSVASRGVSAPAPLDSPSFTGVGGTTLSGDDADPRCLMADPNCPFWNQTPWDSTTNIVVSALGYIPETVWNDTAANGTLSASGSGVSLFFSRPSWQPIPTNYSGPSGRFIPDVSFAASGNHDGYMFCTSELNSAEFGTMCADGFFSSGGTSGTQVFFPVGGTSASAPSFAGMLTLLVQKYGLQGNINPTLYGLAADPAAASVFHDITSGNNFVPCVSGTTGCGAPPAPPGMMGFSATTGFDLTTGLGSIDGGVLLTALDTLTDFAVGTPSPTSVTVTAGNSSPLITIGVSGSPVSSAVSFSCTGLPTGASCSFDPPLVSPGSGSASTKLTITTTARAALIPPVSVPPFAPLAGPQAAWQIALALAALLLAGLKIADQRSGISGRERGYGFALLFIGLCLLQASCGSGGGGSTPAGTPAGSYPITVNAVAGSNHHSATVTLNVQ